MKIILTSIFLAIPLFFFAQCECTDCPIFVPSNSFESSFLDISGAINDDLGVNGQQVCQVCIDLVHDAIEEFEVILFAPDGSSVTLMVDTGISVNDGITFEICFVSCDQTAVPDAGFPDVFDTGAGWQDGASYSGSYYPNIGCLEDLTGSVNGTWELQMEDDIGGDEGTMNDWYIVFADDSGLGCANAGDCGITTCDAHAGELQLADQNFCEGDPALVFNPAPSYSSGAPDPSLYGYYYVVSDPATDVILDIVSSADLTSYASGEYLICGLSYLLSDGSLIPVPNGSLATTDIQSDIDNNVYCADLSTVCFTVIVDPDLGDVDFVGPTSACAGETVQFEILNYDPDLDYLVSLVSGSFSFFIESSPGVFDVAWTSGPGEICASINTSCPTDEVCIVVDIDTGDLISISGNLDPCPGATEQYTLSPVASGTQDYTITLTGGLILSQTSSTVDILWFDDEGVFELCAELTGTGCLPPQECVDINIDDNYEIPVDFGLDPEYCLGDIVFIDLGSDINVLTYFWSGTGVQFSSANVGSSMEIEAITLGTAELCVEVETVCNTIDDVCQTFEILDVPMPIINDLDPTCELSVELISDALSTNTLLWTQTSGPSTASINTSSQTSTFVDLDLPGIYEFNLSETNGICSGTDQVLIEILPDLVLSNLDFDCSLDGYYTVSFDISNGTAPYTVNGSLIGSNSFSSSQILSGDMYDFDIQDDLGCSFMLEGFFDCPCLSMAGTMSADNVIACAIVGENFQAEHNNDAFLDPNDIGVYILHTSAGSTLGTVIQTSLDGVFTYTTDLIPGEVYYLSYVVANELNGTVDFNDTCLSVAIGQTVVFLEVPDAELDYAEIVCGMEVSIEGTPTGIINDYQWVQVSGPGVSVFSDPLSLNTDIIVTDLGTYQYQLFLFNEACESTIDVFIEYTQNPQIVNLIEECIDSGSTYNVLFELVGNAPFQTNVGVVDASNFYTSPDLLSGDDYNITITDVNGCTTAISGSKLCDCITDAGLLDGTNLTLCMSDTAFVANDTYVLDPDDEGYFVLHNGDAINLGDILVSNQSGVFSFDSSLQLDSIYFISFIAGNENGDLIDFLDPCLDISNSITISWQDISVDAGTDQSVCESDFELNASPANGQWELIDQPTDATLSFQNISDPTTGVSVSMDGKYELVWNASDGVCSGTDTLILEQRVVPEVEILGYDCDDLNQNIEIQFNIINAPAPYTINGLEVSGSGPFTEILAVDEIISIEISSSNECSDTYDLGPFNCDCISDIGTFTDVDYNLCSLDALDPNMSNGDFVVDEDQQLIYVVHDGSADNIGNIIETSSGNSIFYSADYLYNQVYFITPVVVVVESGQIDFTDPCIQLGTGVPLMWNEVVDLQFSIEEELCAGSDYSFSLPNLNSYPVELLFIDQDNQPLTINLLSASDEYVFTNVVEDMVLTLTGSTLDCVETVDGSLNLTIKTEEVPLFATDISVCNNAQFGSTLLLSESILSPDIMGQWNSNGLVLNGDILDLTDVPAGNYTIGFSTEGFQDPCVGAEYILSIDVVDCDCPIFDLTDLEFCNIGDFDLSSLDMQNFEGSWSLINSPQSAIPPSINGNDLLLDNTDEGIYTIVYLINDLDYPSACNTEVLLELVIEQNGDAGSSLEEWNYCTGDSIVLKLEEMITGQDMGGYWEFEENQVENMLNTSDLPGGVNNFQYILSDNGICPGDTTTIVVEINRTPELLITSTNVECYGESNGTILINTVDDTPIDDLDLFLDNTLIDQNIIESLGEGFYTIYAESAYCLSQSITVEITQPEILMVNLGDDLEVEYDDIVVLEALTNVLESNLESISWSDLENILGEESLELSTLVNGNTTISIEITDQNGCVATDAININLDKGSYYIPNVIRLGSQSGNETFKVFNLRYPVTMVDEFSVFDRWGNRVHQLKDVSPDAFDTIEWDGRTKDKRVVQGVYTYILKLAYLEGNIEIIAGNVTVLN